MKKLFKPQTVWTFRLFLTLILLVVLLSIPGGVRYWEVSFPLLGIAIVCLMEIFPSFKKIVFDKLSKLTES